MNAVMFARTETRVDSFGDTITVDIYKSSLSPEELDTCLSVMKSVADAAKVEDKTFESEVADLVHEAIARGRESYKRNQALDAEAEKEQAAETAE